MSAESLSGKGKKARDRLAAIESQVKAVRGQLRTVEKALLSAAHSSPNEVNLTANLTATEKRRSAVGDLPSRIEFRSCWLPFYIDFTLSASKSEGLVNVEGCIVYSVSRPLCFADCIFAHKNEAGCENCDRILRCDRFEDKPLVRFSVNRDGIIRSSGELDDQWQMLEGNEKENRKTVLDLHYRALDHIWGDALNWTNENILP